MALIKMGIVVAEARGKLNGGVFTRSSGGATLRTKVTPINPASNAQQLVRAGLSSIAQSWRSLTSAQRAGWEALSQQLTRSNIFGDNVILSGNALYARINRNRQVIGQVIISDAPALPALSQLTALTLDVAVTGDTFDVGYAPTPVPAGHTLVVQATPQISPGRAFVKGRERQVATVAAAAATPYDGFTAYTGRFGALVAGNAITVRAFLVHIASGFNTIPLAATDIVAA